MAIADTGKPVFLPFRMSSFVLSNLVVTAGMLTPGLQVRALNSPYPFLAGPNGMGHIDNRHPPLANSQPIAQRRH